MVVIAGRVFNDINHNGKYDDGEPGILDAYIVLGDGIGTPLITQSTVDGFYGFEINEPGTYTVWETVAEPTGDYPPTLFTQPDGFTVSNGVRKYTFTLTAEDIDEGTPIDELNFAHDIVDAPLKCDSELVLFTSDEPGSKQMNWVNYNIETQEYEIKGSQDIFCMPIAHNPTDGYLYGGHYESYSRVDQIVRIDNNFNYSYLGMPESMPQELYYTGCFDPQGFLYMCQGNISDKFYTIDLRANSATFMKLVDPTNGYVEQTENFGTPYNPPSNFYITSWTFASDGMIYCMPYNDPMEVLRLNPTTGGVTTIAVTGDIPSVPLTASCIYENDEIYAIAQHGECIKYSVKNGAAEATYLGKVDVGADIYAGAMCHGEYPGSIIKNKAYIDLELCEEKVSVPSNNVDVGIIDLEIIKSVSCPWAVVGSTLTYCVTIINHSSVDLPISKFRDTLDSKLIYVNGSFTVNGVPHTPTISGKTIEYDLDLEAGKTVLVCFKAKVI